MCVDQGLGFMMIYLPNSLYILYAYINKYIYAYMETLFRNPFIYGIHTHTHSDMGLPKGKRNFALNPFSIKNGEMTWHIVLPRGWCRKGGGYVVSRPAGTATSLPRFLRKRGNVQNCVQNCLSFFGGARLRVCVCGLGFRV